MYTPHYYVYYASICLQFPGRDIIEKFIVVHLYVNKITLNLFFFNLFGSKAVTTVSVTGNNEESKPTEEWKMKLWMTIIETPVQPDLPKHSYKQL